jgi:hypothetical protein
MSKFIEIAKEKLGDDLFFPVEYYLIEPPKKGKKKFFNALTECDFYKTKQMTCQTFHKHITKIF